MRLRRGRPPAHPSRRGAGAAVVTLAAVAVLGGCSSSAPLSPPTGVDLLTVPTPSPDPDDFVGRVDNPWFPLEPGAVATLAAPTTPTGAQGPGLEVTRSVSAGPDVAGVPTTALTTVTTGRGAGGGRVVDLFAQDVDGNVWWMASAGGGPDFEAGVDGAEAGLWMPAQPRYGDGWLAVGGTAGTPVVVTVVAVDQDLARPGGSSDDVVVLQVESRSGTRVDSYAPGEGLVRSDAGEDEVVLTGVG